MEIRLVNSDEFEDEVSDFQKLDFETIMNIVPKWAYGNDLDKLYEYAQHPKLGNYKIFNVNLKELIENVELFDFDLNKLFVSDLNSDYRVVSTLKRWINDEFVDPPTIMTNPSNGKKLSVIDGRHRLKVSYILKQEKIPIAIHETLVKTIGDIITLESI